MAFPAFPFDCTTGEHHCTKQQHALYEDHLRSLNTGLDDGFCDLNIRSGSYKVHDFIMFFARNIL